ncbi:MAG TPA: transcriptional regulator [Planctomycetaceae bacterium]|nr:transcriptional regulator [Planctomycetaceae bacterium]
MLPAACQYAPKIKKGFLKNVTTSEDLTDRATEEPSNQGAEPSDAQNPAAKYWIGFDLGGTKMQCCLFDEKLKKIAERKRRTRQDLGVEAGLDRIADTIEKALSEAQVDRSQLLGIGIGCPGPVEWDTGIVRVAVNLGWKNVKVRSFLSERFGCPVEVLNDVDAGVYGEYIAGAGKGSRTTVGIFPGKGVGGGCVYDGQILRGRHLSCMEIGHIKISSSTSSCGSDMSGTLEAEASRLAVAGELAKLAFRGEAPHLYEAVGTDVGAIRSKVIFEAIAAGDKEVEKVLSRACEIIGQGIANVVLLICPDCVVLGGGLIEAMPERFLKQIISSAKKGVFECYRDQFEIRVAKLGTDAGAVGCAAWTAKMVAQRNA